MLMNFFMVHGINNVFDNLLYFQAVRVEHCERVHVIVAAKRICIANCRECVFFLGVNQQPLVVGDNHKLQVCQFYYAA